MAISNLPLLYVVIDIESIGVGIARSQEAFSWIDLFLSLFQRLKERNLKTALKVLLISYGSAALQESKLAEHSELVVSAQQSGGRLAKQQSYRTGLSSGLVTGFKRNREREL